MYEAQMSTKRQKISSLPTGLTTIQAGWLVISSISTQCSLAKATTHGTVT